MALDPVIHPINRLQICAVLSPHSEVEFALLREEVGVSASVLSKQLKILEEAGYIALRKATVNTRQRTWVGLTGRGRKAFNAHMERLRTIAAQAEPTSGDS